jgi:maleate cis-trans isomerase
MTPLALGLLVPASNRVMEQDFARWLPPGGRLHAHRMPAPATRPDDMRDNLRALTTGVAEAARLVSLAEPDVIAFGCTSGSFLRGAAWDAQASADIDAASRGRPAVLTARAVVQALRALTATRIVAVSPYPAPVNRCMAQYLGENGIAVLHIEAVDGWGGGGIHAITPRQIEQLVLATPFSEAEAVLASCTNLRAGEGVGALEALTGKPVVTSNQATFWACARAAGFAAPLPALGRLGAL